MAIEIEIDPDTGKERHIVGGVARLVMHFNQIAKDVALAESVTMSYVQPGNQQQVTIKGRMVAGGKFEAISTPQPASRPLAEIVEQMALKIPSIPVGT